MTHERLEKLSAEKERIGRQMRDLSEQQLRLEKEQQTLSRELANEPTFWPKRYNVYLHSSKEDNCETMEDKLSEEGIHIPEEDDFWRQICYACYEVEINCLVYRDGNVKIIGVSGKKISDEDVEPEEL